MFSVSDLNLNRDELHSALSTDKAGAIVVFEGWVRDHNEGKKVSSLEYQVYKELALKEGHKIMVEAMEKFNLHGAKAVHREGHLKLGEIAIWIGATASHRDDAFKATRYIIDEIKYRLPVWKKEHYVDQKPEWVFCRHHHHHVHFGENDYYQKQALVVDQQKLKAARVLVVGMGGLGCPASMNLAAAGVGSLGLVDFDKISLSNIHRQPLYSPNLVGEKKVSVAAAKIQELNPFIQVKAIHQRVDMNSEDLFSEYDLILDCTDNMESKFVIHDLCFKLRLPLISSSVYKFEGQVRTFIPGSHSGCLRCFVKTTPDDSLLGNCNDFGVTGATTGFLGSLQASEALLLLTQGSNTTTETSFLFNLKNLTQLKIKNQKALDCLSCAGVVSLSESSIEINSHDLNDTYELIDIRNLEDDEVIKLSSSKKMALCCHRGVRSKKLTESLRAQGHQHVYSLKGGACSL